MYFHNSYQKMYQVKKKSHMKYTLLSLKEDNAVTSSCLAGRSQPTASSNIYKPVGRSLMCPLSHRVVT